MKRVIAKLRETTWIELILVVPVITAFTIALLRA
jgi:hypothetical protein